MMSFHKSQVFFYLLLGFLSGIFVASIFNIGQSFIYVGLVVAVGLIGMFGYQKSFHNFGLLAGFALIAFLFGVMRFNSANFGQDRLDVFTDLKAGQKGIEVIINGYIDDEPINRGERQEFIIRAKELIAGDRIVLLDDRILVTVKNFPRFSYGNIISVKGALRQPENLTDLGHRSNQPKADADHAFQANRTFNGIDYVTYLKKEGVRTTMFYPEILSLDAHNVGVFEKAKISLYRNIFSLKNKFESAVSRTVSEPNASFVNGILLGSRQNIPDDLKEAFNKTGTTHILAISGYNIMIISWAVLVGLTLFFRRRTAFYVSVVVIFLFVILTGASSSVVRAAVMGLLLLFAQGYGRLYNPKNSIIFAGAIMVWLNPLTLVFDIGFQLSFAAVLGLMYIYPRLDGKLQKIPRLGKLKEITLMTISAQAAVSPILIYYFKNFSLVSLPANVLIVPFLPASMFAGFISGLAGMASLSLGQISGWFTWAITTYQIEIIRLFAGI